MRRKTKKQIIQEAFDYYAKCRISPDQEDIINYIADLYPERLVIK
jgi:hypothetical protein